MGNNYNNNRKPNYSNSSGKKPWQNGNNRNNDRNNNGNNSGTYNRDNRQESKSSVENYVGAPYNFVSLSDTVYTPYEKLISHGEMNEELLNGEIEYTITAETPIFVDSGIKKDDKSIGAFHRNGYGEFSIPGSTMRGLIRNNVQILGLSSVGEDIDDYSLMYRKVGAPSVDPAKRTYEMRLGTDMVTMESGKSISVIKNVRAGYIQKKNGEYYIYQTKVDNIQPDKLGDMNYYVVREKSVVDAYHKAKNNGETFFRFDFFAEKNIMQNDIECPYKLIIKEKKKKNGEIEVQKLWRGRANKEYVPYFTEVCYRVSKENCRLVNRIAEPTEENQSTMNKGYIISTGFMDGKQVFYIIPEIDESKEAIRISHADLKHFNIDYNKRESKLGDKDSKQKDIKKKEFFMLPEEGEIKPVFYISLHQEGNKKGTEEHTYFGFTPRLRIFYDYSIAHGIKEAHRNSDDKLDYAKALFGYTGEDKKDSDTASSYKSRLSFGDAVVEGDMKEMDKVVLTLGSPSPTSFYDYLTASQNKDKYGNIIHHTYNDSDFEIRGIKQYWLHDVVVPSDAPESKMSTVMRPLPKNTKFKGKIRFKNLKKDELGLLLWSLCLENGSSMNVGKAKAYGYGRIKVSDVACNVVNLEKAYMDLDMTSFMNPYRSVDIDETIAYYKNCMKEQGKINIEHLKSTKEFLAMKNANNLPDKKDRRYMSLEQYKLRNRKGKALPSINQVLEKKE
ncbi:MAG: TIGR03986 family CRISPR-associated RAMP protein [Lachnospiraceae bacterium]|nr:TIGR03986 family CRISPR-associated RAMP protein [Lachnospiraceae bacterium]